MTSSHTILRLATLLALALGVGAWYRVERSFADDSKNPLPTHDFSGKVVMLEVDRSIAVESKSSSLVLKDPIVTKIGDRYFIRGLGHAPASHADSWYHGVEVGVAWDSVARFYAMPPEKFEEYAAQWNEDEGE